MTEGTTKETETSTEETTTTEESSEEESESANSGEVIIYKGNQDASGLLEETVKMEEITPERLVNELKRVGILDEDAQLFGFELDGKQATLNLSTVPTYGTAGESITLGAIGNTFIKAYNLDRLRLLVDGKNYSSGHIEFSDDDYLEFVELK